MYADVGYLNGREYFYQEKALPLAVSACGHYRMDIADHASTTRPKGLVDYQLLYIAAGQGHFYFSDGKETLVTAGQMVLYRPGEAQNYTYLPSDMTDVYWIHFTGTQVEHFLETHAFPSEEPVFNCGILPEYQRLYQSMIRELQLCHVNFEEQLVLLLQQLFIAVQRYRTAATPAGNDTGQIMSQAIVYFREHYHEEISIESFAADLNMSTCWFIRSFKHHTGLTPLAFILKIRISTAQHLLLTTSHNIGEIAAIVGYENPLYFCRLFKKHTGVSPTEYRRVAHEL